MGAPVKVTIGIPCFNAERWLQQCLASALGQQEIEVEVIVVDDGSTDASRQIARDFGQRVQWVEGPHQGANHARNLAWQMATGEWIQFLDADDYLEAGKIAGQLREAKNSPAADVLYSPVWIETVSPSGTQREISQTSPEVDWFTQWFRWQIPQTGGALWRRTALAALGGWKPGQPCCQEHELYLRALQAGLPFAFCPTPGAVYRIWSEETLCRKDPLLVIRTRSGLMDQLLDWLAKKGHQTPGHRQSVGQACFEMARTWARFDLPGAIAYHAERQRRDLMQLTGPAASWPYRLLYRTLGFAGTERLARALRPRPSAT